MRSARIPFPDKGNRLDNGSEFINAHLLRYCDGNKITFTRSSRGHKNDGAHIEQKRTLFVGNDRAEVHDVEIVDEQYRRLARRRLPEGWRGSPGCTR